MVVLLKKLEQAAKQLGSEVKAVYYSKDYESELAPKLEESLPKEPSEFMKLYMRLGQHITMVKSPSADCL